MASLFFRVKKKMASATMNTKMGRTAVKHFIGEEGNKLLDALKSAITKVAGAAEAKEKKKDVMKLALKFKMMVDKGQLNEQKTAHLHEPIMQLCTQAATVLGPHEKPPTEDEKKAEIAAVGKSVTELNKLLAELLKDLMKPKNLAKLEAVLVYVSAPAFLQKLRDLPEMKEERAVLVSTLDAIISAQESRPFSPQSEAHCMAPQCHMLRVTEMMHDGKVIFPGSELCAFHHYSKYDPMLREPDFMTWLANEDHRNVLQPFLNAEGQEKALTFCLQVDSYSSITNPATRKTRAPKIFQKYVESKELGLDGATVAAIREQIESDAPLPKLLFQPAQETVRKRMEKLFTDKFLKTAVYAEWVATVTLPESVVKDLKKKLEEAQKKADAEAKAGGAAPARERASATEKTLAETLGAAGPTRGLSLGPASAPAAAKGAESKTVVSPSAPGLGLG